MRRLFGFFERSRRTGTTAPGQHPLPGENWTPGELAECIYEGPWYIEARKAAPQGWGPSRGELRIVGQVEKSHIPPHGSMLGFAHYGRKRFDAGGFRKIQPRADAAVAADEAFTQIIRRESIAAPAEISLARAVVVHLVLPVGAIALGGYCFALALWAVTAGGAAV